MKPSMTIENVLLHTIKEETPDYYQMWTNRLGVCVFGLVSIWLVYQIMVQFLKLTGHWNG